MIYCLLLFPFVFLTSANNINVTNVSVVNVSGGAAEIQFDISWSNSWAFTEIVSGKNITNHDAAWVFIKFRSGAEWKHAWLSATGHYAPTGARIDVASNGGDTNVGAFIYRSADGFGGLSLSGVRLKWEFSKNGVLKTNNIDISVQAIEMVYIPECSFYIGSGGDENSHFYKYPNSTDPYYITNSTAINIGQNTDELYYASGGGDHVGPIPSAFPNGYKAFYCMKYEITQGQYTKFLDYLPSGYDYQHYPNKYGQARHTINLVDGNFVVDTPDRACNWLSWSDVCAYCDWAGLRPMTELEFEKACRGSLFPIQKEYPWGDTTLTHLDYYDGVDGSGTETAFPTNANCHSYYYHSTDTIRYGPARAGIFARSGTTRHQAGAGYYGVMELGGNVYEQAVSVGYTQGRAFNGCHGDGYLQTLQPTWPTSTGSGKRGGSFTDHYSHNYDYRIRTSDRYSAAAVPLRESISGGRGVRSAE